MSKSRDSTGVAIIGVGESDLGIVPGRSSHSFYAQAINAAIADAGLDKSQIDGLITLDSYVSKRTRHAMSVAQCAGFRSESMRYIGTSMHGSMASSGVALQEAMMAIRSGVCNCVVVAGGDNFASMGRAEALTKLSENRDPEFESIYGTLIVGTFALIARRYMADCGATEEDFAEVALAQRAWANLHPNAQMGKKRITKAEVLASPMIATPFRRLNCPLVSDGGNAMVVTSLERARAYGSRAVTVLASEAVYGSGAGLVTDDLGQLHTLYALRDGSTIAVRRALDRTGLTARDFDVYFSYDPFAIVTMLYFEALGLCGAGEGAAFVRGGRIAPGGSVPWNTHGGLHSYCHPGVNGGMYHLIEAVRQLRHEGRLAAGEGRRDGNHARLWRQQGRIQRNHYVKGTAMSATARPLPQVSPESEPFWSGCKEGRLLLQYCNRCGKINWFPRRYCAYCAAEDFSWKQAAGTGVLETYSIVHRAMSDAWQSEVPYILAIVRLSEGIRMVTRLIKPQESRLPTVDAPVQVRFVDAGEGWRFPFFEEIS